jgi:pentatricopeptide repeat protein
MKVGQVGETEHFKGEGLDDLRFLLECNSVESMRAAWCSGKRLPRRKLEWPNLMLSAMHFYPERAPDLLRATIDLHITPSEMVVDTICYLFEHASLLPAGEREERQAAIADLLLEILGPFPPRYFTFPQWLLGRMASVSQVPFLKKLHYTLFIKYHPMDWNTQFKFANCLARDARGKSAALRILEKLIEKSRRMASSPKKPTGKQETNFLRFITLGGGRVYQWVDLDDPNFQRRFDELATAIASVPKGWKHSGEGSPFTLEILNDRFKRLIDIGIPLNLATQNAMLQAICSTGDLEAAWNLYNHMLEQGTKPDVRAYLLLLNAAKRALSLESTMRVILDAPAEVLQSRYIWNEFLSTIIHVATEECNEKKVQRPRTVPAFDFMLQIYKKFFKLEPLNKLLPSHLLTPFDTTYPWDWRAKLAVIMERLPALEQEKLVDPGADTLRIMFHGYVKGLSNASLLVNFYAHFRTLLKNGDPLVLGLLRDSTQPYDVIVKAVTDHPGLLRVAADILNDVLRDAGTSTASGGVRDLSGEHPQAIHDSSHSPVGADPQAGQKVIQQGEHEAQQAAQETDEQTTQEISTDPSSSTQKRRRRRRRRRSTEEDPFTHPLPSVHTWNAILAGFFRERRVRQSWRIFELMRQHGVEPNKVTWNTLIAGYTATGENQLAVETLLQFEKLGYQHDEHTRRQLYILYRDEPARRLLVEADKEQQQMRYKRRLVMAQKRAEKRSRELQAKREEHLRKLYALRDRRFPSAAAAAKAADAAMAKKIETGGKEEEEELSPTADFFKMYDELIFQAEQQ